MCIINLKWLFKYKGILFYMHNYTESEAEELNPEGNIQQEHPQWDCHLHGETWVLAHSVAKICEHILIMTKL